MQISIGLDLFHVNVCAKQKFVYSFDISSYELLMLYKHIKEIADPIVILKSEIYNSRSY